MSNLTDIKTGAVIKIQNQPYLVVWNEFNRKQMRKPVMRTKLKSLIDGSTLDKTFLAGESFEFADIERKRCQYLYTTDGEANFMNNESYEQFTLSAADLAETLKFLKDDTEVYVTLYESRPIGVQPPVKAILTITETTPGVRGDTATGGSKAATVETGAVIQVPLFIKEGEKVIINTETGEYVGRTTE